MISLCFLGAGLCVSFYRKYRINYIYIFEIDPVNRLNQYEFYKIFLFLLSLLNIFMLLDLFAIKGYIHSFNEGKQAGFALILMWILLAIFFCPLNILFKTFRMALLYSLFQNLIAPFGYVGFRDFVLGDIITSFGKPLFDFAFLCYFFSSGAWRDPLLFQEKKLSNFAFLLVSSLPFYLRFW